MSTTSMTIATFKKVAVLLPPTRSILIKANHGVGKSKVIKQVCALLRAQQGWKLPKFPVIDWRLSQMSEGDVIGLPSTDGEVTRFNPPDRYRQACLEPAALFLDELNRATPEVMQTAFQIALDRELNGMKTHPLSRVFSAVNVSAQYTVNEIDPALLDRFFVCDLEPSAAEFVAWGRNTDPEQGGNLHFFVPDFIESAERWLYPARNHEPGTVQPSPRSWEFVDESLKHAGIIDNPENDMFWQITRGFVGNEAAIAFRDYCKSVDNRISGEDIVNKYNIPAIEAKVKRQTQDRQNGLIEKVADYVLKNCHTINKEQGQNIKGFIMLLPQELRISLWSKLTSHGIDKIELCKSIHKHCAENVLEVFGVPMGEAGIGIVPNIPGIFRAPAKGAK
jgi:hypothetical protein